MLYTHLTLSIKDLKNIIKKRQMTSLELQITNPHCGHGLVVLRMVVADSVSYLDKDMFTA